jgi:hypothetical protein
MAGKEQRAESTELSWFNLRSFYFLDLPLVKFPSVGPLTFSKVFCAIRFRTFHSDFTQHCGNPHATIGTLNVHRLAGFGNYSSL